MAPVQDTFALRQSFTCRLASARQTLACLWLIAWINGVANAGCGADSIAAVDELKALRGAKQVVQEDTAREASAAKITAGDANELVTLLGLSHATVRERFTNHSLACDTSFTVTPAQFKRDQGSFPAPRRANAVILEDQHYRDAITLRWQAEPASYHFTQRRVDPPTYDGQSPTKIPESGHEIIRVGDQLYTHHLDRVWYSRLAEDNHDETWLNDAYGCVGDALSIAGTALAITKVETSPEALQIIVGLSDDPSAKAFVGDRYRGLATWRKGARVRTLTGSITLDRARQIWTKATLDMALTVDRAEGGPLNASLQVRAQIEPLAPTPAIAAPAQAQPWPERQRYSVQANELLDGLAPRR